MNILSILTLLLPLLLKLLELFKKTDPAKLNDRQRERLGKVRTACQQFEAQCKASNVGAVALSTTDHE